jgi:quinol monooxygenase YgiN
VSELVVVNRFRVGEAELGRFREDVHGALATLAAMPGYVAGHVARNLDEPDLWLLTTTWTNVGSYRRALSSYGVKVAAVPLLSQAIDEPSAYETTELGGPENEQRPRELG